MSSFYQKFETADGIEVLMRTVDDGTGTGEGLVGVKDRVVSAVHSLDEAIDELTGTIEAIATRVRAGISSADEVKVVVRANIGGKASIKVFETSADAGIEFHLKWKASSV